MSLVDDRVRAVQRMLDSVGGNFGEALFLKDFRGCVVDVFDEFFGFEF
jgi:hypothetical protein